jgi:hypothetical protein
MAGVRIVVYEYGRLSKDPKGQFHGCWFTRRDATTLMKRKGHLSERKVEA